MTPNISLNMIPMMPGITPLFHLPLISFSISNAANLRFQCLSAKTCAFNQYIGIFLSLLLS